MFRATRSDGKTVYALVGTDNKRYQRLVEKKLVTSRSLQHIGSMDGRIVKRYPDHVAIINSSQLRNSLWSESEAFRSRLSPTTYYNARDLPAAVLSNILLRHGVPQAQIPRMLELTYTQEVA